MISEASFYFFEYAFLKTGLFSINNRLKIIDIAHSKNDFKDIIKSNYPQSIEDINPFLVLIKELKEYLDGKRKSFTIDYKITESIFEKTVLKSTINIPYGEVRSYKQIASAISRPDASRAVGNALAHNKLPIIIPCHRVVRSDGSLGGFGGGSTLKMRLLIHEGINVIGSRVNIQF